MTELEAWRAVEAVLSGAALPYPLPLYLDDNPAVPISVSLSGGAILKLQAGGHTPYASPQSDVSNLVFTLIAYFPAGISNGIPLLYSSDVHALFLGKSLLNPSGGPGVMYCTRTQSDILGVPADGRALYQINIILVFRNLSYS